MTAEELKDGVTYLKSALAGAAATTGAEFLPDETAEEIIGLVYERSFCRQAFPSVSMTRDTLNLELMSVCAKAQVTTILVTHSINEAAFLSDRVVVLAARPARITDVVEIPFPRPRTLDLQRTPEFQDMLRHLRSGLTGAH